jgi:hypothetical protein
MQRKLHSCVIDNDYKANKSTSCSSASGSSATAFQLGRAVLCTLCCLLCRQLLLLMLWLVQQSCDYNMSMKQVTTAKDKASRHWTVAAGLLQQPVTACSRCTLVLWT